MEEERGERQIEWYGGVEGEHDGKKGWRDEQVAWRG